MDASIVVLQYGVYLLEAGVLGYVLLRRREASLLPVAIYLGLLLAVDGISRPYILYAYGFTSLQYAYIFWLTDVLLTLGAFLLVCLFFRRACVHQPRLWYFIRLLLVSVLILVFAVSLYSLTRNYRHLFTQFIVEFQQNLFFTCLVLNTLLYILMQQLETADEELMLLVCGLGIQFAGPAANFALVHLTPGHDSTSALYQYLGPLCTMGMLLTWFYTLNRATQRVRGAAAETRTAELATVVGRES